MKPHHRPPAADADGPTLITTPTTTTTTTTTSSASNRKVMYFVDHSVTSIAYAEHHVMRPSRVRVLHALVRSLGLDRWMTIAQAAPASEEQMGTFHRRAYLECLRQAPVLCGDPFDGRALSFQKEFDVPVDSETGDCPLFPEVWDLVRSQAGASLACAEALLTGAAQVAINWSGGMHHAAAAHASGFCFVNDIVLCIQRLLRRYLRVLYVDLDVHHGDGVEGAFYGNPRVMTLSLHQFGHGFFPGTGDYYDDEAVDDMVGGEGGPGGPAIAGLSGRSFAVNAPLPARTGDAAYLRTFRTALAAAVPCFDPQALVVQCGADAIAGDLLGRLCISTMCHTQCVAELLAHGLPTVLVGGGGYHVHHTARCWAVHTATAIGRDAVTQLPLYIPRRDAYYMAHREGCAPLRPLLHVVPDPDVDRPLEAWESEQHWRRLCRSLCCQMAAVRAVRQRFDRTVTLGREALTALSAPSRAAPPNHKTTRSAREGGRRLIEGDAQSEGGPPAPPRKAVKSEKATPTRSNA